MKGLHDVGREPRRPGSLKIKTLELNYGTVSEMNIGDGASGVREGKWQIHLKGRPPKR